MGEKSRKKCWKSHGISKEENNEHPENVNILEFMRTNGINFSHKLLSTVKLEIFWAPLNSKNQLTKKEKKKKKKKDDKKLLLVGSNIQTCKIITCELSHVCSRTKTRSLGFVQTKSHLGHADSAKYLTSGSFLLTENHTEEFLGYYI